jgi:hypothetical protein
MAEDETNEDSAAEAFERLREEVAELTGVMKAFEEVLRVRAPDYSPTLGVMAKRLQEIESHPALQYTPQRYGAEVGAATDAISRRFESQVQGALASISYASGEIGRFARELRGREAQRKAVVYGIAGGLFTGAISWALVAGPAARALPASWQIPEQMAAATLRRDRWNAGARLMETANRPAWDVLVAAERVWDDNYASLSACIRDAEQLQKPVACKVTVKPSADIMKSGGRGAPR